MPLSRELERTYSPSLSDDETRLSAIERLAHRGRSANQSFDGAEWLFWAVQRFGDVGNGRRGVNMDDISHNGQPYPGSTDGMSMNRALYSLASDVLVSTARPSWGVAGLQSASLPPSLDVPDGKKKAKWALRPKHVPTKASKRRDGIELPENFAHCVLMHYRNEEEKAGKKVKNDEVRFAFSTALVEALQVIAEPEETILPNADVQQLG